MDIIYLGLNVKQVFEPSEIRARLLTEDDDLIRAQDIPERMQLATSSLSSSATLSLHGPLTEDDLNDAAGWVSTRISTAKTEDFFSGSQIHLREELVLAVSAVLRFIFIQQFEVPYIWIHKRDYITHFDTETMRGRVDLLSLAELWRINSLGLKYRSLLERRRALDAAYARMNPHDEYYEGTLRPEVDSVEQVADATEWLTMKYKQQKDQGASAFNFSFFDDEVGESAEPKQRKMPSRISAYEIAKKSIVSKLADVRPQSILLGNSS